MKIIGVTGLIGSGKTEASGVLGRMGAYIIDADISAHKAILRGNPAYGEILEVFGEDILDSEGEIDRKRLGAIVFADPDKLSVLNALTHKHILRDIGSEIEKVRANPGSYAGIALEAIYLFESGLSDICDMCLIIVSEEESRLKRVMSRDRMSPDTAKKRILSQKGICRTEALTPKDHIIHNNGNLDEFIKKVEELALHVFRKTD